jgi:hypothetical protein
LAEQDEKRFRAKMLLAVLMIYADRLALLGAEEAIPELNQAE